MGHYASEMDSDFGKTTPCKYCKRQVYGVHDAPTCGDCKEVLRLVETLRHSPHLVQALRACLGALWWTTRSGGSSYLGCSGQP